MVEIGKPWPDGPAFHVLQEYKKRRTGYEKRNGNVDGGLHDRGDDWLRRKWSRCDDSAGVNGGDGSGSDHGVGGKNHGGAW